MHTEISGIGNDSGGRWTWAEKQQEPAVLSNSRADSEETWQDDKQQKKGRCALPSLTPWHIPQSIDYICYHLKAKKNPITNFLKVSIQMC